MPITVKHDPAAAGYGRAAYNVGQGMAIVRARDRKEREDKRKAAEALERDQLRQQQRQFDLRQGQERYLDESVTDRLKLQLAARAQQDAAEREFERKREFTQMAMQAATQQDKRQAYERQFQDKMVRDFGEITTVPKGMQLSPELMRQLQETQKAGYAILQNPALSVDEKQRAIIPKIEAGRRLMQSVTPREDDPKVVAEKVKFEREKTLKQMDLESRERIAGVTRQKQEQEKAAKEAEAKQKEALATFQKNRAEARKRAQTKIDADLKDQSVDKNDKTALPSRPPTEAEIDAEQQKIEAEQRADALAYQKRVLDMARKRLEQQSVQYEQEQKRNPTAPYEPAPGEEDAGQNLNKLPQEVENAGKPEGGATSVGTLPGGADKVARKFGIPLSSKNRRKAK